MRLTSIAAGLLILILAGFPAISGALSHGFMAPPEIPEAFPGARHAATNGVGIATPARGTPQSQQDQTPQSQQTLKVGTTLVNVFATVRDKHHAIVSGLTKDDFKVYEDGVEQKVAFFSKEMNLPITLAILIDTSGSEQNLLGAEQEVASQFVQQIMRKKDEGIVINFDTDVNLLADFTEDPALLERAIRRAQISALSVGGVVTPGTIPNNNVGGTVMYDAIYLACHDELATENGRKVIIALTDAEDEGSKLPMQEAIESAQRADTVVYFMLTIDIAGFYNRGQMYSGASVANRIASDTGGRVFSVRSQKSLEKAFDELKDELRDQYILGYYPANEKHDGAFRKIKVETSREDLKVLARRGYYAPSR